MRFDLELHLIVDGGRLAGSAIYNTDLFDDTTVHRLCRQHQALLRGLAADPGRRLSELELLDAEERHQLLVEWSAVPWNGDRGRHGARQLAHERFAAQAAKTPAVPALELDGRQVSYRRLDRRSDRLAAALERRVGAEMPVGVYMERSFEMVVAMLGIFKAGCVLIPLDPTYPAERLSFVLDEVFRPSPSGTGAGVILSQERLADELPAHRGRVFCLDDSEAGLDLESDPGRPRVPGAPAVDRLAYVIYTSGSMGRPKGVAMRHEVLANLVSWQTQITGLKARASEGARTLQFASLSFDICFQEMFPTWSTGGTVVLLREEHRRDPGALLALLVDTGVDRIFLPVVALQQLAEAAVERGTFPARLRQVYAAGEQLQITSPVARFFEALPGCTLFNHYGPTECHVVTTQTLPEGESARWPALPPIGRPVASTDILVLDRRHQPAATGTVGEVYIGGANLARGYLHRPGQTAERFVPHPYDRRGGARLYRTGDLARPLADGTLEFWGRIDHQVKIRGFRVELGEIETVLEQHPHVQQAVVIARAPGQGERFGVTSRGTRLAACVVISDSPPSGEARDAAEATDDTPGRPASERAAELRDFLAETLPRYMLPADFVSFPTLPLDANGKVDRGALGREAWPAIDLSAPEESYVAPRDDLEEDLARIWAEVLGYKTSGQEEPASRRIGVHDDFFTLGGHSLAAVQVISRVREVRGLELPLRQLFEHPTVASLAESMARQAPTAVTAGVAEEEYEEGTL